MCLLNTSWTASNRRNACTPDSFCISGIRIILDGLRDLTRIIMWQIAKLKQKLQKRGDCIHGNSTRNHCTSQRKLSRRQKDSQNRKKAKKAVAKLHYKIGCMKNDFLHKLTTTLTQDYRYIVIEDLDISKMLEEKKLSSQIMNGSWFEFRRPLCYKAELRGNKIFIADRWYASTK